MPRKLRAAKERYDAEAEVERWSMMFECGADYFRESGVTLPLDIWPPEDRPPFERALREAARAAWQRVGARFLERRDGANEWRDTPWALEQFGDPPCQ